MSGLWASVRRGQAGHLRMFSALPVLHSNDTQRSIGCFNEGKLWNTCFIPVEIVVLPSLQLPLLGGAVGARGEEQSRKISRLRFCGYSALRVSPPLASNSTPNTALDGFAPPPVALLEGSPPYSSAHAAAQSPSPLSSPASDSSSRRPVLQVAKGKFVENRRSVPRIHPFPPRTVLRSASPTSELPTTAFPSSFQRAIHR